jgi:hypothetical protein
MSDEGIIYFLSNLLSQEWVTIATKKAPGKLPKAF